MIDKDFAKLWSRIADLAQKTAMFGRDHYRRGKTCNHARTTEGCQACENAYRRRLYRQKRAFAARMKETA